MNWSVGAGLPVSWLTGGPMDFTIPSAVENYRARIAAFVERELIPLEADPHAYDPHENIRLDLLSDLRGKARAEGLWCLQLKPETGRGTRQDRHGGVLRG